MINLCFIAFRGIRFTFKFFLGCSGYNDDAENERIKRKKKLLFTTTYSADWRHSVYTYIIITVKNEANIK